MMMCSQCSQQNSDEAHFCHQCGAKLAEATTAAETASDSAHCSADSKRGHALAPIPRPQRRPLPDRVQEIFVEWPAKVRAFLELAGLSLYLLPVVFVP